MPHQKVGSLDKGRSNLPPNAKITALLSRNIESLSGNLLFISGSMP